jgi:Protein of unknown function (DUF2723)
MPATDVPALPARVAAAGVAAIGFGVYLRTLMPGVAFADWGEMQVVPHVLGVAHPTGYPTYILLAWLAQLVPIGTVAFRANLLSAILVAATLATVVLISVRLGVRPLIAAAGGLALGAVGTVWAAATVAEVNPLHLLLIALILHRALVWEDRLAVRDLAIGGLLIGLALGNHLLTLFIAPFIVVFVLWAGRRTILDRPWLVLVPVVTGVLGLAVYLYIPLAAAASPPLPYNHPLTLEAVLWLVTGAQFRGQFDFLSSKGPGDFVAALPALWALLGDRSTPLLSVLGLLGLPALVRRRPAFGLTCLTLLVLGGYLWANYLRLEHYLLVPWLLIAVSATVGVDTLADLLARRWSGIGRLDAGTAVGAVAIGLVVLLGLRDLPAADRSADVSGPAFVEAVFATLPADAAILTPWDASTPLWYGQHVEGRRPDVLIVDDTNIVYEGWGTREARIASLVCQRPVYVLRLDDADLLATLRSYDLEQVASVRVGAGGPSASLIRSVYRVTPRDPSACGG